MKPTVDSKSEYYRRWFAGEFGNKPTTWTTVEDCLEDPISNRGVSIRYKLPGAHRYKRYGVSKDALKTEVESLIAQGAKPEYLVFSERLPDDKLVIQGELYPKENHSFHYSRERGVSNYEALYLLPSEHSSGIVTKHILDYFMPSRDKAWLDYLCDTYPAAVLEFSTFSCFVGDLPGYKTIFWEVRNY